MSNQLIRDQARRLLIAKHELKRKQYKAVSQDRNLAISTRYESALNLSKLPRNGSKTRARNRCIFTGRGRSIYTRFKMSRIMFRELASKGAIIGVLKSSW